MPWQLAWLADNASGSDAGLGNDNAEIADDAAMAG